MSEQRCNRLSSAKSRATMQHKFPVTVLRPRLDEPARQKSRCCFEDLVASSDAPLSETNQKETMTNEQINSARRRN